MILVGNLNKREHREFRPCIRVDRRTVLGNPYHIGIHGDRAEVIEKYSHYLREKYQNDASLRSVVLRIASIAQRGDIMLLCHCVPLPCHAQEIKFLVHEILDDPI